jgi:hypothetical protein
VLLEVDLCGQATDRVLEVDVQAVLKIFSLERP